MKALPQTYPQMQTLWNGRKIVSRVNVDFCNSRECPQVPHDGDIRGVSDSETGCSLCGLSSGYYTFGYLFGLGLDANTLGRTGGPAGKTDDEVRNLYQDFNCNETQDSENLSALVSIVEVITKSFNTEKRLSELRSFVDANKSNLGSAGKALEAAIDATVFNSEWVQRSARVIAKWLQDHLKGYMTERLYRQ